MNINAKKLFNKYCDINIVFYNTNKTYEYIINNYKLFDFVSGRDPWILNTTNSSDDYFWYDRTHISPKGNNIISNDINKLLKSINN